jgi:hypothetical protein
MAEPSQFDVHVNAILTNISVAYMQNTANFIAPRVFPVVPVQKQSDLYFKYTKNDWFRDEAQIRADATESAGSGYGLGTDSYFCDVYALHKDIGGQTMANADAPLNLERDATEFVTQRLQLRQEIQWAADYFKTGVWGTSTTPANLWSDYSNSDPIGDIEVGKTTVLQNTGFMPNTLTIGYQVFTALKNHPDIVDRYKYTSADVITEEMLAALFGVDRLLVARGIKATNAQGQSEAYSFIQGKHALLTYSPAAPSLLAPSAGYTFMWQGVSEGLGQNIGVKNIPMPHLNNAQRIEGQIAFDNKVVATDLGYMFVSVVS